MANTKLSAFLSLLLVFCSGALVGVLSFRAYSSSTAVAPSSPKGREKRPDPEEARKQHIAELQKEVHLDNQELADVQKIYDDTRDQFMQIRRKSNAEFQAIWENQTARVKAILRPDQLPLYEALLQKQEAARDAEKKKRDAHKGSSDQKK